MTVFESYLYERTVKHFCKGKLLEGVDSCLGLKSRFIVLSGVHDSALHSERRHGIVFS